MQFINPLLGIIVKKYTCQKHSLLCIINHLIIIDIIKYANLQLSSSSFHPYTLRVKFQSRSVILTF